MAVCTECNLWSRSALSEDKLRVSLQLRQLEIITLAGDSWLGRGSQGKVWAPLAVGSTLQISVLYHPQPQHFTQFCTSCALREDGPTPSVLQWELLHPTSTQLCSLLPPERAAPSWMLCSCSPLPSSGFPPASELETRPHYWSPLTRFVAVLPFSPPKERRVGWTEVYGWGAVRSWLAFLLNSAEGTGVQGCRAPTITSTHTSPSRSLSPAASCQEVSCACTSGLTSWVRLGLLWFWFPLLLGFDTCPIFFACWEVGEGQTHHIK